MLTLDHGSDGVIEVDGIYLDTPVDVQGSGELGGILTALMISD